MTRILQPDAQALREAADLLRAGDLVAFPTETVYGLGADAANPAAVRRIFEAKGRPVDHPVIVHVPDPDAARGWAREFPADAERLARAFWPGPLTLIVPRAGHVDDAVTGGQDSVGLRMPSHPVAQALLRAFGGALAAPSANRFGHVSPTRASHVADDLGDAVPLILDGGACDMGIESTIVAFTADVPILLRPGAIAASALAHVLGREPLSPGDVELRAPGRLPSHYAPRTPATLLHRDALRAEVMQLGERDEVVAVLAYSAPAPDDFDGVWIQAPADVAPYAHDLYANLRRLDEADADAILIEDVPPAPDWDAVRDRLLRATQGEDDDRD